MAFELGIREAHCAGLGWRGRLSKAGDRSPTEGQAMVATATPEGEQVEVAQS